MIDIQTAVAQFDAATNMAQVRQIEADWRAAYWEEWVAAEKKAKADDGSVYYALKIGDMDALELDGTWKVDYPPTEIQWALVRASRRRLP